jgi:hypothetical protein
MIPTVEEVLALAAGLLGERTPRKFTAAALQPAFEMAYEELTEEMARNHLVKQLRTVVYPLAANTTSLTPAAIGISNFGELYTMEERIYGSTGIFTLVTACTALPQRQAVEKLIDYEWSNDTWNFIGATVATQLRIRYYDSGAAPTTGTCGIDGCKNFLAYRVAAIAGFTAGNKDLARDYDRQARGPVLDNNGGFIFRLIQAAVTGEQASQLQMPIYHAQNLAMLPFVPGLAASEGGSVGAPSTVVPTGTIDGSNETFTLASTPLHMTLYLNGVTLLSGTAYTLSGATIAMAPGYIPQVGDLFWAEVW